MARKLKSDVCPECQTDHRKRNERCQKCGVWLFIREANFAKFELETRITHWWFLHPQTGRWTSREQMMSL